MNPAGSAAGNLRMVAGRTFEERNGVWTDLLWKPPTETIDVEPFSSAYFAVLRALPELEPIWKTLPASVVKGKRVSIGVKAGGRKQLTDVQLRELVLKFRN
jgi:hypothetical protein